MAYDNAHLARNRMTRKGYGRIYVINADDREKVSKIIKEMDEFEWSYMPVSMIAPISEYPAVVYTGKFDALDLDALTVTCLSRGIGIFCFDAGNDEYPDNKIFTGRTDPA